MVCSCNSYKAPEPRTKIYVTLDDFSKDTLIVLPTHEVFTTISYDTKGNLSDTTFFKIGINREFPNGSFGVFFIPSQKVLNYNVYGLLADTLFIEHKPLKRNITGEVTIEFTLYNDLK
jgi:hypothetical protein